VKHTLWTGWLALYLLTLSAVGAGPERRGFDFVIRGSDGVAVTNVLVWIRPRPTVSGDWRDITTDAEGRGLFRTQSGLEQITMELARSPDDSSPYFGKFIVEVPLIEEGKPARKIKLTAAKCAAVEGRLVGEDGKPLKKKGIQVVASGYSYPGSEDGSFRATTQTEADGTFRFPAVPSTNIVGVSAGDRHFLSREPALVNVVSGYAKTDVVANPLYWLNVSLWRKSTDGKLEAWSDYEGILEYKSVDPHWHGWGSRDFKDGKSEEFVFRGAGLYRFVLPRKVEEKWMIENPDFRIPNKEPEIRLVVVPKSPLPETAIVVVAADKGNPVAGAKVRIRAFPEDMELTGESKGSVR
jgi:hypothetical protein